MHKGTIYRILRCLVCLILVCCILINCSPIRAKAVPIAVPLTGAAILALTLLMAAGVVIIPSNAQIANSIGDSFLNTSQRVVPDQWEDIVAACDLLDNFSPEWDPGEFNRQLQRLLSTGLLSAIGAMVISAVADGFLNAEDVEFETVQTANIIHDPTTYPLSANGPFILGVFESTYSGSQRRHFVICSGPQKISWNTGGKTFNTALDTESGYYFSNVTNSSGQNVFSRHFEVDSSYIYENLGEVVSSGIQPFYPFLIDAWNGTYDVEVVPEIYVGDIPQQIQDGEDDPEKLMIPPIDPLKVVTSPDTAFQEITNTAQQLKDGSLTYEEYIDQFKFDAVDPDPGTGEDPGDNPGQDPDPELGMYTLDLKKFFPFCIPFDLYDFLTCLAAEPVAPVIEWVIPVPGGDAYPLELDLSPFDSVAQLLRRLQLLLFCIGLAVKTRDLIKG